MKTCTNCGKEMEACETVCSNCGCKLEEIAETEQSAADKESVNSSSVEEMSEVNNQTESTTNKEIKDYPGIKISIIVSCFLGIILEPITACWSIPMSIYIWYKVQMKRKIGFWGKLFSWVLISPLCGMLVQGYNEQ